MSVDSPPEKPAPLKVSGAGAVPLLVVGGLFAALIAAALLTLAAGPLDRDVINAYGPTVVRVIAELGGVLTVGSLLFAAFLVSPQQSGTLDVAGYAALRMASWCAALWFAGAAVLVPFTVASAVGKPVSAVLEPRTLFSLANLLPDAKAWMITAAVALLLAVGARVVLSWGWTVALLLVALGGIVPVAVTGHSSSREHDLASNSLLLHLFAAALWVGGLAALLVHGRRAGQHLGLAASRFSRIALVCWITMAVSGVINALIRLPLGDLFTTSYGVLVLGKASALGLLGVVGYFQRERGVKDIVAGRGGHALFRLAAMEVLIMFATIGLATALARTPPPPDGTLPDPVELQIGYGLDGPPTLLRLLFDWRIDLVYLVVAGTLAALYLVGVRRLRARGDAWPVGRTVAWLGGCFVIIMATSSGFGRYAPAMFSIHMETHMMLSMLAPVLLVLGGPVTLALRAIPPAGKDAPPGPREWLLAAVHSPVARALTHPVVALVLFVGSFYVLYMSGLFDAALELHWAHLAMNAHFLLVGYVFYWPVIGIDPAPRRLPHVARLGMVFASLPFHAFFGVILMSMQTVIGERFYRGLGLPWAIDLLADQRLGGGIAWATGELPLLVVLIALLMQWARADEREARRADRRADADGDAELEAYNAMLRQLAERDGR
ncbi:MAG TPA: cytochrome c oxidase assembly protein [Actinophytocola sp.]|uniref:cytochrome c oxidase assembly protein n=1 Tax=Actinophytocola sp. TaxID=1872138 RepID=UPI002DFAE7C4|nr:cytochrome c oxidase assembly protein [Actinophytocola sp.]